MSSQRHPKAATLAAFAAGALDEARAVVVATHLEACAACRIAVRDFEALGGVCLEAIEPAAMADDALQGFWRRAGQPAAQETPDPRRPADAIAPAAAAPLGAYLKGGLAAVDWRPLAPGVAQSLIAVEGFRRGALRLLKFAPGSRVPKHTHRDNELTLVLQGSYDDEFGRFACGDLADLDEEATHSPRAVGDRDCICLIAINAPLAFTTLAGKILQPLIGF